MNCPHPDARAAAPCPPARHLGAGARRNRGFAIVLILVLAMLMMMLVILYLRTLRAYSVQHPLIVPDANPVQAQLVQDLAGLIGSDGKIGPSGRQTSGQVQIDIHEPYDYPWTKTDRFYNPCRVGYPRFAQSQQGMGDPYRDDAWLTAEPESGALKQVANIVGSFLVYTDADLGGVARNPSTREFVPDDAPAGAAVSGLANGQFVDFQNLSTSDARLVDTDGDGVGDALWFYPRNNVVGGLRYVAAVKVSDLSGCVNLNTALGELATNPKGEGPYEINASGLVGPMPNVSKDFRFPTWSSAPSFPLALSSGSYGFWMASGGRVGSDGQTATGVNATVAGVRTGVRYDLYDEVQLRDLSNKLQPGMTPQPILFDHYPGLSGNLALRNRLTTLSGAVDRAAPPPFSGSGSNAWAGANWYTGHTHRAGDLNLYQTSSPVAANNFGHFWGNSIEDYYYFYGGAYPGMQELLQGVDSTTPNDDYPFPEGFKTLVPTASDRPREYQILMAACLQDALSRDNRVTEGWNWMGWKPLPLLTEFYGEMPYITGWDTWVTIPQSTNPAAPTASTPGATTTVFANTSLSQVKSLRVVGSGTSYNTSAYFWDDSVAGKITFQIQGYDGTYTRARKVELTQVGADVVGRELWYHYANGDARGGNFDQPYGTAIGGDQIRSGGNWGNSYIGIPYDQGGGNKAIIFTNTQRTRTAYTATSTSAGDARYGSGAGIGSYAFEMVNPYAVPIRLSNIRFRFLSAEGNVNFDGQSPSVSNALDTFVVAGNQWPAAASLPATDAEGFRVLKPGEKIIFYRNGTENTNKPDASTDNASYYGATRPNARQWQRWNGGPTLVSGTNNVDLMATLFPSGLPANTYAINLGTTATAPEWNGHYNNRSMEHIELQVSAKYNSGSNGGPNWYPYSRLTYTTQPSGYNGYEYICEGGIPAASCPLPGHLVYRQVSARTFGVDQKLNLLQARPPASNAVFADNPTDWGDEEFRTNLRQPVSGLLNSSSSAQNPLPALTNSGPANNWSPGYHNTASTTPLLGTYAQYQTLHLLGQSVKVAFPGPNGTNPIYAGGRQDIRDGALAFNHLAIPSDAVNYPGTFPELRNSMTARDNPNATLLNGALRRDGTPRAMDIGRIMMVGPVYSGNGGYRGGPSGTYNANPTVDQLVSYSRNNTIGDAVNFYLAKDRQVNGAAAAGLPGLCLRADKPFYDASKIADARLANKTLTQLYADLDAKQAQLDALPGPPPPPAVDPDLATRATYTADLATLQAGIRGQTNWTRSWADVVTNYFQVDSPKYKGKTPGGSDDFKPGTVNINTAPAEVLDCLSLVASGTSAAIVAARRNPAAGAASGRKGLGMVSELVENGVPAGTVHNLPQQASCRSDVFCATIVLQGYKQDDFTKGPLDVRRSIVFFSRDTSGNPARVLGTFVVPNQ